MDLNDKNITLNEENDQFFKKVEIPFDKDKEEIWDSLNEKLTDEPKGKVVTINWYKLAAAAVVLLLVGAAFFMRIYTTTVQSKRGQHLSHILPDGSVIEINAESSLSYHPYWWKFSRNISFEGEAFFEVEKGKRFNVVSENGTTEVLGTSFNVFARENDYKVYCETGKVKVSSKKTEIEFIINPGEIATIDHLSNKGEVDDISSEEATGWKMNKFNFTSVPLRKVFQEVERQYNVEINFEVNDPEAYIYAGFFTKTENVISILDLICQSFDLKFVQVNENQYKVLQD